MMLIKLIFCFFFFELYLFFSVERKKLLPNGELLPQQALNKALFDPVLFPCNECEKLIDKYIIKCVNSEIQGAKVPTFLTFCETLALETDPKYNSTTYKFCLDIHNRVLQDHKQPEVNKPDYNPFELDAPSQFFLNYKLNCEKFGNLPTSQCYSSLCEKLVECIDCPFGLNQIDSENNHEFETCSGHGICRLGWLNDKKNKGGNGYCECYEGRKGLACDQISQIGYTNISNITIQISKKS